MTMFNPPTVISSTTPELSTGKNGHSIEPIADLLEQREIEHPLRGKRAFPILVIDTAEKWVEANTLHTSYQMPILGMNEVLEFPMTGLSLKQWHAIEEEYPIPQWRDEEQKPDEEFTRRQDEAANQKNVAIFEAAVGRKIPGETLEEKSIFLSQRNPGEVDALFAFCWQHLCNFSDGPLLHHYLDFSQGSKPNLRKLDSFDAWQRATECKYIFRMQRPFEEYILEFPLRGIDQTKRREIDEATKIPSPPTIPKRIKGHFDPSQQVPDVDNPAWIQQQRAILQKRLTLYCEACLTFPIPGVDVKQKYDWLSLRLVGDIQRLSRFLDGALLSYRERYDFFTIG